MVFLVSNLNEYFLTCDAKTIEIKRIINEILVQENNSNNTNIFASTIYDEAFILLKKENLKSKVLNFSQDFPGFRKTLEIMEIFYI